MAKQSRGQKKTMERVMHEFKHGELKSGPEGRGGKVKSRRQAVAIALHEAGSSKYESKKENERSLRRTKRKEREGKTALAETEGRKELPDRSRKAGTRKRSTSRNSGTARKSSAARKPARKSGAKAAAGRKSAAARKRTSTRKSGGARRKSSTRR